MTHKDGVSSEEEIPVRHMEQSSAPKKGTQGGLMERSFARYFL